MKHVLITGCSTGFGLDAAKHLATKGHRVYASMRGKSGKNRSAADDLRAFAQAGKHAITVLEMDVTSDESVRAGVALIPQVDVLINNAGVGFVGPVESFSSKQILDQLDVNIVGTMRVASAVLPGMRARKSGLIIQISSIAGLLAFPSFGVYHASKWGLEGISEALRYELGPLGVDVVMVEPGPFSTSFFGKIIPGENTAAADAYPHVAQFGQTFEKLVGEVFADPAAPTDPKIVIDLFEHLINTPSGKRPFRNVAGLDFGARNVVAATLETRKQALVTMEIADWDGPQA